MIAPARRMESGRVCCSSTAAKSPMAEFLKGQSPQELWKASLKPDNPLKPEDPFAPKSPAEANAEALRAATAPGTAQLLDIMA